MTMYPATRIQTFQDLTACSKACFELMCSSL